MRETDPELEKDIEAIEFGEAIAAIAAVEGVGTSLLADIVEGPYDTIFSVIGTASIIGAAALGVCTLSLQYLVSYEKRNH